MSLIIDDKIASQQQVYIQRNFGEIQDSWQSLKKDQGSFGEAEVWAEQDRKKIPSGCDSRVKG